MTTLTFNQLMNKRHSVESETFRQIKV